MPNSPYVGSSSSAVFPNRLGAIPIITMFGDCFDRLLLAGG